MARIVTNQTNFTGGELSPRMKGRTDVARYQAGAETLENVRVVVHGGADRRDGLRYLATAKRAGADVARVIPYVYSEAQAFCLELGAGYARVFDATTGAVILDATGTVPLELALPYTGAEVLALTYAQDADKLYLFHPGHATQLVRRLSATLWISTAARFVATPFAELGHVLDRKLSIDNPAVGAGRTMTSGTVAVPNAPTGVTAQARNGGALVTWVAPAVNGGAPVLYYVVTASPGGLTAQTPGDSPSLAIAGLANGTAYTFTVKAHNKSGDGVASAASAPVTPNASAPLASLSVAASASSSWISTGNGTKTGLAGPTASASTGTAPFKYQWVKLPGGSGNISVTAPGTAAQLKVDSNGFNTDNYGAFRCTVTDAKGASGSVDVSVTVSMESSTTTGTRL